MALDERAPKIEKREKIYEWKWERAEAEAETEGEVGKIYINKWWNA